MWINPFSSMGSGRPSKVWPMRLHLRRKAIWKRQAAFSYNAADTLTVYDCLREYRQQMEILLMALKTQD